MCFLDYLREACQLVDKVQAKSAVNEISTVDQQDADSGIAKKGKQISEKKKKGKKMFADKSKETKKGSKRSLVENLHSTGGSLTSDIDPPLSVRDAQTCLIFIAIFCIFLQKYILVFLDA